MENALAWASTQSQGAEGDQRPEVRREQDAMNMSDVYTKHVGSSAVINVLDMTG